MKKQKFWIIIDDKMKVANLGYNNALVIFFSKADAEKTLRDVHAHSVKNKKYKVKQTIVKII
jgi:hypothetical protein